MKLNTNMKKQKIDSTPQFRKQITFSSIFSNTKEKNIDVLLENIPTHSAIEFITFWNFQEVTKDRMHDPLFNFIPVLFKLDTTLQHTIVEYLQKINIEEHNFVDRYALLRLTEELIQRNNQQTKELTEKDYSALFKAYLICCEEQVVYDVKEKGIKDKDSFLDMYIPFQMKQNDLDYPLIYVDIEIIKFYCFVIFCHSDNSFSKYIKIYLEEYGFSSWTNYLYSLFRLFVDIQTNKEGKTNKIVVDKDYNHLKRILEEMCINRRTNPNIEPSKDFTKIRAKPIFRYDEDTYIVLFIKFFKDKFFHSFLFDLARVLSIHKEESGIYGYPQLKQLLGQYFSEQILFYKVINRCFAKNTLIKYSGEDLKNVLIDGEPDFYIRKSSRIFLFEYKDIRFSAKIKYADSLEEIRQELIEQFEETSFDKESNKKKRKKKPKGITQLLNVISEKLPIILREIDIAPISNISVFPIIVYQDSCLDIDGINYLVNKRFLELKSQYNLGNYRVKDVVMVNIDTLIKLEDFISSGKLDIGTCINNFISYKESKKFNSVVSFNRYLMIQAYKKGYNLKFSTWFKDIMSSLEDSALESIFDNN